MINLILEICAIIVIGCAVREWSDTLRENEELKFKQGIMCMYIEEKLLDKQIERETK